VVYVGIGTEIVGKVCRKKEGKECELEAAAARLKLRFATSNRINWAKNWI